MIRPRGERDKVFISGNVIRATVGGRRKAIECVTDIILPRKLTNPLIFYYDITVTGQV